MKKLKYILVPILMVAGLFLFIAEALNILIRSSYDASIKVLKLT